MSAVQQNKAILPEDPAVEGDDNLAYALPEKEKTCYDILREAGIDYETTRRAWFTLSHVLLDEGARVLSTGCGDGTLTFTMAVLYPRIHFIGLDKDHRLINQAAMKYELPNLEFKVGDMSSGVFAENSLDAIINSQVLHSVYSGARYNRKAVEETLRTQFAMLKPRGLLFIQDYLHPPPERFVEIELPDEESASDSIKDLCDADLLEWYAEHARPLESSICQGFFLEEMESRSEGKRSYRLPYKWAYEFIMRLSNRDEWEHSLPTEYMVFTPLEFRQTLQDLGARVQYSAPHWDEGFIDKNFRTKFRLFDENGAPLHYPPTSFVAVAIKMEERKSLHIEERRPSSSQEDSYLTVNAMRNLDTGDLVDLVTPKEKISEMIPYRVNSQGRLKIYLNDGVARSITNAVTRSGQNIDGKRWSGHMVEAIGVAQDALLEALNFDEKDTIFFAKDYLGLRPRKNARILQGPDYYPSPDYINERIYTYYLNVRKAKDHIPPKPPIDHAGKFHAKGQIREFDAQQVLDAITVGAIPNARLELQILSLFEYLKIKPENWTERDISVKKSQITADQKVFDLIKQLGGPIKKFQDVKDTAGQLRPIHSVFVEEGQENDSRIGLSAQEVDFVVQNDKTINSIVVLPLASNMKNELHAGLQLTHFPVPQCHQGSSLSLSVPNFELPAHIRSLDETRAYIAEKFEVLPEMVFKLGESYFSHIGITPQRIHPYAIIAPPQFLTDVKTKLVPLYQIRLLQYAVSKDVNLMTAIARSYRMFGDHLRREMEVKNTAVLKERFAKDQPSWSLPVVYEHPLRSGKGGDTDIVPAVKAKGQKVIQPQPFHGLKNIKNKTSDLRQMFPKTDGQDLANQESKPKPEKW